MYSEQSAIATGQFQRNHCCDRFMNGGLMYYAWTQLLLNSRSDRVRWLSMRKSYPKSCGCYRSGRILMFCCLSTDIFPSSSSPYSATDLATNSAFSSGLIAGEKRNSKTPTAGRCSRNISSPKSLSAVINNACCWLANASTAPSLIPLDISRMNQTKCPSRRRRLTSSRSMFSSATNCTILMQQLS